MSNAIKIKTGPIILTPEEVAQINLHPLTDEMPSYFMLTRIYDEFERLDVTESLANETKVYRAHLTWSELPTNIQDRMIASVEELKALAEGWEEQPHTPRYTHAAVANLLGVARQRVSQRVQRLVAEGKLSASAADGLTIADIEILKSERGGRGVAADDEKRAQNLAGEMRRRPALWQELQELMSDVQ